MDNIFSVIHQIHLGYIPKRNEYICLPKNTYKSIHCTLFTIARNQSDVQMCTNSGQGSSTTVVLYNFPGPTSILCCSVNLTVMTSP